MHTVLRGRAQGETRPFVLNVPAHVDALAYGLNIKPHISRRVCCPRPSCCALYPINPDGTFPQSCSATHSGAKCGYALGSLRRTILGIPYRTPIRVYNYRPIKEYIADLLSKPGLEELMDSYVRQAVQAPPSDHVSDSWFAPFLRSIQWGRNRAPNELRLVFSLSIDWFTAHSNHGAGGKSWSIGAVYLVCLNLPPKLRFLPENVCLVGLIPGPTKPIGFAMDNFMQLLVDELRDLFHAGVFLTRTTVHPSGRLCRAFLGPVIADLDAVRSIIGMRSHSFKQCCSLCDISTEELQNRNMWFLWRRKLRNVAQHAREVAAFCLASDKESYFKATGVRDCPLNHLGYIWDPCRWAVIEPMHNLLLGITQRHLRSVWGMDFDVNGWKWSEEDSRQNGTYHSTTDPGDLAYAYVLFCREAFPRTKMNKLGKSTVSRLSDRLQLGSRVNKPDMLNQVASHVRSSAHAPTKTAWLIISTAPRVENTWTTS